MVKFVVGKSTNELLFNIIFWIGSGMQIICAFILYFFTEKKYDYIGLDNHVNITHNESINETFTKTAAVTPDDYNSE
jgi:hypothetical protein